MKAFTLQNPLARKRPPSVVPVPPEENDRCPSDAQSPDAADADERTGRFAGWIREIPAMRQAVSHVIRLIDTPRTRLDDIETAILSDQALTADLLRLANSAYHGLPREVYTVREAMVFLGLNTVRSLAVTVSTFDVFSRGHARTKKLRDGLWEDARLGAVFAKTLAETVGGCDPEVAYVAGLLHDIGKLVFLHNDPDLYARACQESITEVQPQLAVEQRLFGIDHCEMGGLVTKHWGLPGHLVEAVRCHHFADETEEQPPLVAIIGVAVIFTWLYQSEENPDATMPLVAEDHRAFAKLNRALSKLGLFTDDVPRLLVKAKRAIESLNGPAAGDRVPSC